jgi:1-acyl-sn-glycerol-3-phosphate acyltransferase
MRLRRARDIERPTTVFRLAAALSRPLVWRLYRLTVTSMAELPPGGFVLCANHLSAFDAWPLSLPLYPRQPRYLAKAELFVPPLRRLLVGLGVFPVRRGEGHADAIATAVEHVRSGHVVLVFPEGARRRNRVLRPRTGAARIALAAGAPLVPAAVRGTDDARRLERWSVAFGSPVRVDDLDADLPDAPAAATRRVWDAILELERGLEGARRPASAPHERPLEART